MRLILTGRRAILHLGLGKALLAGLKRLGAPFLTSAMSTSDGKILAQKDGRSGLLMIESRDPTCLISGYVGKIGLRPIQQFFGGWMGEPFIEDILPTHSISQHTLPPTGYYVEDFTAIGGNSAVSLALVGGHTEVTPGDGVYPVVDAVAVISNWQRNVRRPIPTILQRIETTDRGAPLTYQTLAVGEDAPNSPVAVVLVRQFMGAGDDRTEDVLWKYADPIALPVPQRIWPPATLNGGKPWFAKIASNLCCYGRGMFMFIEWYYPDPDFPEIDPIQPELVRVTDFGTNYSTVPLLTALGLEVTTHTNTSWTFTYCGTNTVTLSYQYGINNDSFTKHFISTDNGTSWSLMANLPVAQADIQGAMHSLQPGHLAFTSNVGTYGVNTSMNAGASWAFEAADAFSHEGQIGVPVSVDTGGNVTRNVAAHSVSGQKIITFAVRRGVSTTDTEYTFELDFDLKLQSGNYLHSTLCVLGSNLVPMPIMPGFPGELEYPQ